MSDLKKQFENLVKNALNRTITRLKNEQKEAIQNEINLANKKLNNMTRVNRATKSTLKASIKTFAPDKAISLSSFNNIKKTPSGVKVKIAKNVEVLIRGGFFIYKPVNKPLLEKNIKKYKKTKIIVTRIPQDNDFFKTKNSNIKTHYTRYKKNQYGKRDKSQMERITREHKDLLYPISKIKLPNIVFKVNENLKNKAIEYFNEELEK